jgi:neutral ceramidase
LDDRDLTTAPFEAQSGTCRTRSCCRWACIRSRTAVTTAMHLPTCSIHPVRRASMRLLLVSSLALATTACATAREIKAKYREIQRLFPSRSQAAPIEVPEYRLTTGTWKPGHLVAGVGRADITPPAGFPTGGYGPGGGFARGYWTRLSARAFFFADPDGRPLVVVSCDLFAIPRGLAARVARTVALRWQERGLELPPESFIIAATHTHQGAANYLTAPVYNQFAAKYSGFDADMFAFLERRIVDAIDAAIQDGLRGGQVTLTRHTGRMPPDLQLNRSPYTFVINWRSTALMDSLNPRVAACAPNQERGEARASGWELAWCPRRRALDPVLTAVTIERGGHRVGGLLFFSIHPTVLAPETPLFNADFLGPALATLEASWRVEQLPLPVIGFFNGAEGDIVATRGARDLRDVQRVADRFVEGVEAIVRAGGRGLDVSRIDSRQAMVEPAGVHGPESPLARLSNQPTLGHAALGGSEDDRTVLFDLGFVARHRVPRDRQGLKLPALDSDLLPIRLISALVPPRDFPSQWPISLVRLGDLRLVSLPFEASTAQGQRIRDALEGRHGELEIIGLANEYASYLATSDEYAAQDYMAASTIWGPDQGSAVELTLRCLSQPRGRDAACAALERQDLSVVPRLTLAPGFGPDTSPLAVRLGPGRVGEPLDAVDAELHRILLDRAGSVVRALPYFEWVERTGGATEFDAAASRRVEMLEWKEDSWVPRLLPGTAAAIDDDVGSNFITVLRRGRPASDPDDGRREWAAIWLAPIVESTIPPGRYKFRVRPTRARAGVDTLESCAFVVNLEPPVRSASRTNCPSR